MSAQPAPQTVSGERMEGLGVTSTGSLRAFFQGPYQSEGPTRLFLRRRPCARACWAPGL